MAGHFDLTDLQLIVHIGDWHSLTRGAEKTHLSLPAASTRVKNLEEHFGTQLLYRTSQGVTLTPSGEALTRHARTVMRQIEQLRGDMQEFARGVKGHVRVLANTTAMTEFMPAVLGQVEQLRGDMQGFGRGVKGHGRVLANTTAMTEFMPAVLGRFLAAHPDVNVELRERLSYLIVRAVSEGSADVGIVAGSNADPNLEFIPYRKDRLVLVAASNHALAKETAVAFADTLDNDYVGLSEWSAIHPFLVQAAEALGRTFKFRIEVGNFEAVCRIIETGVGIGVIPESVALRFARVLNISIVPLTD